MYVVPVVSFSMAWHCLPPLLQRNAQQYIEVVIATTALASLWDEASAQAPVVLDIDG